MFIILVEDDPVAAADLALLLPRSIDFVRAENSRQAIAMLDGKPLPDAIVLDMNLPPYLATNPDEEGLALLELIRRELAPSVPVIVHSRNPETPYAARCRRLGVRTYLQKPCRVSELVDHLLAAIGS